MRYLMLGLLLLALLLTLCLRVTAGLSARYDEILLPLEQAEASASQGFPEKAEALCREAAAKWEHHYPVLAAVCSHKDLEEVRRAFAALEQAKPEDFLPQCSALLSLLRSFREADLLSLHNLL